MNPVVNSFNDFQITEINPLRCAKADITSQIRMKSEILTEIEDLNVFISKGNITDIMLIDELADNINNYGKELAESQKKYHIQLESKLIFMQNTILLNFISTPINELMKEPLVDKTENYSFVLSLAKSDDLNYTLNLKLTETEKENDRYILGNVYNERKQIRPWQSSCLIAKNDKVQIQEIKFEDKQELETHYINYRIEITKITQESVKYLSSVWAKAKDSFLENINKFDETVIQLNSEYNSECYLA